MIKLEAINEHWEILNKSRVKLELAQQEWVAYNKVFNEWLQQNLDFKDRKGEVHMCEILQKALSDQSPIIRP